MMGAGLPEDRVLRSDESRGCGERDVLGVMRARLWGEGVSRAVGAVFLKIDVSGGFL